MKGMSGVFFVVLIATSLSACSKSKNNATQDNQTIREIQVERIQIISTVTYALDDNGCSTGSQVFTSIEEMCSGLQNNTLNNKCALELREDHFKKNCAGKEFKAFDDKTNTIEITFKEIVEQKKMRNGDIIVDTLKVTPMGTAKKARSISFACAKSIEEGMKFESGFILLNGTKALINRDQTTSSRKFAHALLECADAENELLKEEINQSNIKIRNVKTGDALAESVIIDGYAPAATRSELTYISCSETKEQAKAILTNGVNLVRGSRLMMKRDVSADLDNGIRHPQEYTIVICE